METIESIKLTERVWAAVRGEPRVDVFRDSIRGTIDQTTATLEGQVGNISVKKHILKRIAALPELTGLVDRLRVMPFTRMDDRQIGEMALDAFSLEPTMAKCVLQRRRSSKIEIARKVRRDCGRIAVDVYDGVVTLDGEVPSLAHKQLAGVLAWWLPGSRDVVNDLVETARADDLDAELADTVGMVLDRDESIDTSKLQISVRDAVVRLRGSVPSLSQIEMAEFDAWYVFGVEGVENGIRIHT